jgi:hypothetical protein
MEGRVKIDPENDTSTDELLAAEQEEVARRAARAATAINSPKAVPSRLSDEQAIFLARIRRTREAGMPPSLEEVDILIGIVDELIR